MISQFIKVLTIGAFILTLTSCEGLLGKKKITGFNDSWKGDGNGGGVSFSDSDGDVDSAFYCLNASSGTIIWEYPVDMGTWSSPAVADGKVVFGGNDGRLYCFNESTGDLIWSQYTLSRIASSPSIASTFRPDRALTTTSY